MSGTVRATVLSGLLLLAALGWTALAWTTGAGAVDPIGGSPQTGLKKAVELCARCHVIGSFNRMGGIGSTPSFYSMQERPEIYEGKLLSVNHRRPHIGIGLEPQPEVLEDIWAYVETLRRP